MDRMADALAVSEGAIHLMQRWSVNRGEPIDSVPSVKGWNIEQPKRENGKWSIGSRRSE